MPGLCQATRVRGGRSEGPFGGLRGLCFPGNPRDIRAFLSFETALKLILRLLMKALNATVWRGRMLGQRKDDAVGRITKEGNGIVLWSVMYGVLWLVVYGLLWFVNCGLFWLWFMVYNGVWIMV